MGYGEQDQWRRPEKEIRIEEDRFQEICDEKIHSEKTGTGEKIRAQIALKRRTRSNNHDRITPIDSSRQGE